MAVGVAWSVSRASAQGRAEPAPSRGPRLQHPSHLQHLYVWLASEKAHERQRAVHLCMSLLKFLSHSLYLDVSTRLCSPTPTPPLLPAEPPFSQRLRRLMGFKARWVPAIRTGWVPDSRVARPSNPPFYT